MALDHFLSKTGAALSSNASPTGPVTPGGANVDYWDIGKYLGNEGLFLMLHVTAGTGTMTPILTSDNANTFASEITRWVSPFQWTVAAEPLYFPLTAIRQRYVRLKTGTVTGTWTVRADLTLDAPNGRIWPAVA